VVNHAKFALFNLQEKGYYFYSVVIRGESSMTSSQAIAYSIVAMEKLGFSFEDIRRTKKEMENLFDLFEDETVESYAAHIMSELIATKLFDVKINPPVEVGE
jgi:undecaprenyl pyrophosphate synthase